MNYRVDDETKSASSLANLLNAEFLASSRKLTRECDLSSREQVKSLLGRGNFDNSITENKSSKSQISTIINLLVADFKNQKIELTRLNRARKNQIENHLKLFGHESKLDALLASENIGPKSPLDFLANQFANFFAAQVVLLKTWSLHGLIGADQVWDSGKTVNWKISSVLKARCPKRFLQRDEWNFLKSNIFSWYSPSISTWESLRPILHSLSDSKACIQQLIGTDSPNETNLHQIENNLFYQNLENTPDTLLLGNWNFSLVHSFLELQKQKKIGRLQLINDSEYSQYIAEISALCLASPEIPNFYVSGNLTGSIDQLKQQHAINIKNTAAPNWQLVRCQLDQSNALRTQFLELFDRLTDNSKIVFIDSAFWPTENTEVFKKFRDFVTKKGILKTILDTRQLVNSELPRCISLFHRCSQKEQRDFSRVHVLRLRGDGAELTGAQIPTIPELPEPGLQKYIPISNLVKFESMMSAVNQGELKSAPWTMLTDQGFFELAKVVKRTNLKLFHCGSLVPNQSQLIEAPKRAIHIIEIPGHGIFSCQNLENITLPENSRRFLFVPDQNLQIAPTILSAWINSSLIQFWSKLENDSPLTHNRTAKQFLNLTPLIDWKSANNDSRELSPDILKNFYSPDDCVSSLAKIWGPFENLSQTTILKTWIEKADELLNKRLAGLKEIAKHLYPELKIERWCVPQELPGLDPLNAFKALLHLPQTNVLSHPAIKVITSKGKEDLRIQSLSISEHGPVAEIIVSGNLDQRLVISGPTMYLKAISTQLRLKIGRNCLEILRQLQMPLDAKLVLSQTESFQELIQIELLGVQKIIGLLDLVFCNLSGLQCSLNAPGQAEMVRNLTLPLAKPLNLLATDKVKGINFGHTKASQLQ